MNKKLKNTFLTLSMGVVLSVPIMSFVSHSQKQDEKTNAKQGYEFDFHTYKLIESIQSGTGPNLEEIYKKMDANEDFQFNIKLITNVSDDFDEGVTDEEKFNFFHKENSKAVQNILKTFKKEITYTFISNISPIVKIRVKKKDLEKIFKFLEKEKSIRIFSYDKEMPFVDKAKFSEAAWSYVCISIDADKNCIEWYDLKLTGRQTLPPGGENAIFYHAPGYKGNYEDKFKAVSAIFSDENRWSLNSKGLPHSQTPTKVGIWESGSINSSSYVWKHMKIQNSSNENIDWHKSIVASIVGGVEGVDKFAQIYDVNKTLESRWNNSNLNKLFSFYALNNLEEDLGFIVNNNIHIVNGSFGYGHPDRGLYYRKVFDYDNVAFYLDYISRRYGITFIFSAGNHNSAENESDRKMHGMKLSINSIKVGSLNSDNISKTQFSVYKYNQNIDLPNTILTTSAPGTSFYVDPQIVKHDRLYEGGTSFSAPIVTGILSKILREKPKLRKNPSSLLMLTALGSKMLSQYPAYSIKNYNKEVGYGIIDYYEVYKAAENVRDYKISFQQKDGSIIDTIEFNVKNGQAIKAAAAWLYNSSYAHTIERSEATNKISYAGIVWLHKDIEKYDDSILEKINKNQLTLLTDYDLILEMWNDNQKMWNYVSSSNSSKNNIEKIHYENATEGKYRLILKKYSSYNNSLSGYKMSDDLVSLSYFVDDKGK